MRYFENLGRFGGQIAAIQPDGQRITYQELEQDAAEIHKKIRSRTLAFCFCKNEIGAVVGYLSFLSGGVVPLLLDAGMNDALVAELLERYQPAYLWMPEEKKREGADSDWKILHQKYGYCLVKTAFEQSYPLYPELGLLLTTSGSTGSPKLVRQSYQNIQANAQAIADYLKLDETERPVTTLPMHYTYGLSIINSHLLVGATLLLTTDSIVNAKFWKFMTEQRATSFGGVPYTYEMLKRMRFFGMDLPDLRTMTQAGGKLDPQLHLEFAEYAEKTGKHFVVMYGQTEATARMAYLPPQKALEKYGSMGIAIPGGKFTLVDVDDREITEAEHVGELVYEGANVTLGYAECGADLSRGDERHGILKTGDMAKRDADGYYYIVGRRKRFLKLYGNRVNLDEIDRMIRQEFPTLDCASTGNDQCMEIYITDGSFCEKVTEFLFERTHINEHAYRVHVLNKIPRNDAGKVLYRELPVQ